MTGQNQFKDSHGVVQIEKQGARYVDPSNSYQWHESEKFWQALEQNIDHVQHIYMAGGEPMLIDQHYEFVGQCVDRGFSKNIILEYNTNMTVLPQKAIDLWQEFKQVRVGASIDGFGEVLELQRYPAKWPAIYRNLQKLDALPAPVMSWLACTVTAYNVLHLPDFMKWKVVESGFKRINSTKKRPIVSHHVAHNPQHLNVRVLSDSQKQEVRKKFADSLIEFKSLFTENQYEKAKAILDSVEKYMMAKSYHESHYKELTTYTQGLDRIRNQDSSRVLPAGL
ncbi:MAG: radical SAM protein [Bdellovibrionales bacterium]|nr:radical SAM protein [Bdellovibrionales bacterium]